MTEPLSDSLFGIPSGGQEPSAPGGQQLPGKEVARTIPFSDFILESPPELVRLDHLASGLAADFSASIDNPYFKLPSNQDERNGAIPAAFTMYAPYYIGTGMTAEEIAIDIAEQAAAYLEYLDAQHNYDGYLGRLMSVLRKGSLTHEGLQEIEDENILFDVHDWLSIITNRLRHVAPIKIIGGKLSSEAEEYRADTHEKVDPYVSTLACEKVRDGFEEYYVLPEFIRSNPNQLVALGWDYFKTWEMRRGAEFAALAAGKVGDPILRDALNEHYRPEYLRAHLYNEKAG